MPVVKEVGLDSKTGAQSSSNYSCSQVQGHFGAVDYVMNAPA